MSAYWSGIGAGLERIGAERPDTFAGVKAILDTMPGGDESACGDAFFGGSGGDLSLRDALREAGWRTVWVKATYWWAMVSPAGEAVTYVEGDVYEGWPAVQS